MCSMIYVLLCIVCCTYAALCAPLSSMKSVGCRNGYVYISIEYVDECYACVPLRLKRPLDPLNVSTTLRLKQTRTAEGL